MSQSPPEYDEAALEAMNTKALQNQFFTPDKVYIDLGLFKDTPLGFIYGDALKKKDEQLFLQAQTIALASVTKYQQRTYDTLDTLFSSIGYTDDTIDLLKNQSVNHDLAFIAAPVTQFLRMLIRHTVRNQNNSRPAAKYVKTMINDDQYVMDAVPVTYYINTHPLTLSSRFLVELGKEFGESLGVNISFVNKSPDLFDQTDWNGWMKDIDCYYLNNLGAFTKGAMIGTKMEEMALMGRYVFARKLFEKEVMHDMVGHDFDQQITMITSRLDVMCDFAWIQNNDVRLTEEPINQPPCEDKS